MNSILLKQISDISLRQIAEKIVDNQRISIEDALQLWNSSDLGLLGMLATHRCEKNNGKIVYFNRNIHIEPTNICINACHFCSYSRKKGEEGSWEMTEEEIYNQIKQLPENITEVHIVGGIHPDKDLNYYTGLLRHIKIMRPTLIIKAFTAVEIAYMIQKAGLGLEEGIQVLKDSGLETVPGGGAEIFDETLRKEICPEKISSTEWLAIHKALHQQGIPTNATMLYGHKESYSQRVDHLNRLRNLQEETQGFNAFIPLKFRNKNNRMSFLPETSIIEDLKVYAVSRIFLDNIPHIKAYWPSIGKGQAGLSLSFGVDDLDGTISDTTKIYSMAGAEEENPSMSEQEMRTLIKEAGKIPTERDSFYNILEK